MKAILLSSTMLALATQASAIVISASDTSFISSPTYFTGFETPNANGMPVIILPGPLPYSASYSGGGLTVSAVGGQPSGGTLELIGNYDYWNGVGQSQWYAPFAGYTAITLTNGGN